MPFGCLMVLQKWVFDCLVGVVCLAFLISGFASGDLLWFGLMALLFVTHGHQWVRNDQMDMMMEEVKLLRKQMKEMESRLPEAKSRS